jgi:hypothetical protein
MGATYDAEDNDYTTGLYLMAATCLLVRQL